MTLVSGLKVNFSKSGISLTLGVNGASVNLSNRGATKTIGVPGSGLSWTKRHGWAQGARVTPEKELEALLGLARKQGPVAEKVATNINKSIARSNVAIESYSGGRGATESKLVTLAKRLIPTALSTDLCPST